MRRNYYLNEGSNETRIARELLKVAKMLVAGGDEEKEEADEIGFDKSELEGIVNDIEKAGDAVESTAEKAEDKVEDELDDEKGANASIFQMNQLYASQYNPKQITAGNHFYKANALAEECRLAAIKVAKYLKSYKRMTASVRTAGFSEGFEETHRPAVEEIKSAIKKALTWFMKRIQVFLDYVKKVCNAAKEAGKAALGFMVKASLTAAIVAIIALFGPIVLAIYGIVKAFGIAKDAIERAFDALKQAFLDLKKAVSEKIDDIMTAVGKVAGVVAALPVAIYELVEEAFKKSAN